MPARDPHFRVHDDRAVESDHFDFLAVRSGRRIADHVLPPGVFDIFFEFDAERAVIPEAVDAAVDARRLEDEPGVRTEFGELRHVNFGHVKVSGPAIGLRRVSMMVRCPAA